MLTAGPTEADGAPAGRHWRIALWVVGSATVLRLLLLFVSSVELYPDEAQYWLWSRRLAFGYFSKPPMIAWLIALTTAVGGDSEPWVRLAGPFMHAGAALALFGAGRRLFGSLTGLWATLIYTVVAGVQLSAFMISTDAPLMLWIALSVWAYAEFWASEDRRRRLAAAAGLGMAIGFGLLTKYAALYMAGGVALHALVSPSARQRWDRAALAAAVGAAALIAGPNLIWNAGHHFQTLTHTADNADLGDERGGLKTLFGARGPFGFIVGQFGVFGPIGFGLAMGGVWQTLKRRGPAPMTLLTCLIAPAFILVLVEAILARANANWAGASYPACAVLAAAFIVEQRAYRLGGAAIALQAAIAVGFCLVMAIPALPNALGAAGAFKRARGWRETAAALVAVAKAESVRGPLSSVAVDDRFLFNAVSYYGRDGRNRPAGQLSAPLTAWLHRDEPANQAEAEAPLTTGAGARVLAVSASPDYEAAFRRDFAVVKPVVPGKIEVQLDPKHERRLSLFLGADYQRRPRDPVSGRPIRP
jgi:4-amino-4-deoxy-L-arabinose transferase-like glycosyltransferase